MDDWVTIDYDRPLPVPVEDAFSWLTDYDEEDPDRAGAIIEERRPVEQTDDRVVLEGRLSVLGRRMEGRAEVELSPPDAWTAHLYDTKDRKGGRYEYRLIDDDGATRLVVGYHLKAPRWRDRLFITLLKPLILREIDTMWDGFVEAMVEDLGASDAAASG